MGKQWTRFKVWNVGMRGGVTTPTSRRCSGRIPNSGKERCTKTDLPSSEEGPGSYRRTGVCVMFWDPERIHQERWGCQENRLADMLCYLHDDLESINKLKASSLVLDLDHVHKSKSNAWSNPVLTHTWLWRLPEWEKWTPLTSKSFPTA